MAAAIHLIYRRLMAVTFAVLLGLWAAEGPRPAALGWITGLAVLVVAEILGQRGEHRDARRRALAHAQAVIADEQLRAAAREAHNRPLPGPAPQTPHGKPRLYAVPDAPQGAPERRRSRLLPFAGALIILFGVPAAARAVSIHSEPSVPLPTAGLSLAQARWFVEREAAKWPEAPARDMTCWRLTPATDACSFWTRLGTTPAIQRAQPPHKLTELVEYTGAPIRMWAAGEYRLTPREVEALGY